MPNQKPIEEQPVARADKPVSAEEQEGVNPIVVNPDQPVFPRPVGLEVEELETMGVDHGYMGVQEEGVAVAGVDPETGTREGVEPDVGQPTTGAEGKPQDPEIEDKTKAAGQVAKDKETTAKPSPAKKDPSKPSHTS